MNTLYKNILIDLNWINYINVKFRSIRIIEDLEFILIFDFIIEYFSNKLFMNRFIKWIKLIKMKLKDLMIN